MHTYINLGTGWMVVYYPPGSTSEGTFSRRGPIFNVECEAAAYACFLNGGRYCPDEIAPLFRADPAPEDDDEPEDHTTPPSKGRFSDYPQEKRR